MRLKYVCMDNMSQFGNTEGFVIFPEFEKHDAMVRKMGGRNHVTAAGFVSIGTDENGEVTARCYGESFSLKVKSREIDSDMITRAISLY